MKISIEELYQIYLQHPEISKDSRIIGEGCIYFSLSGDNFDGNKFADDALSKGAAYAVIDNEEFDKGDQYLLVEDSLTVLQDLARQHRAHLQIPIVGITGSNGKTTTKELISTVLAQKFNTYSTAGNYNNHIGVPLSILSIRETHEIAVIEMGANHQGEIAFLSGISNPDHGMITNIGKAHLEGFGGIEGVKKGKSELYKHLQANGGLVFVNLDDDTLVELSSNNKIHTYGRSENADCIATLESSHPNIKGSWKYKDRSGKINANIYGAYNFNNMLAAICIGNYFGVDPNKIDKAVNEYESDNNRSEIRRIDDYTVYLDAYNANPSSTKAAIDNFEELDIDPQLKLLILGDMFELGDDSLKEHETIISYARSKKFGELLFVGKNYFNAFEGSENSSCLESTEEAKEWFKAQNKKAKHILIKGSRGMALEKLLS